MIEGNGKFEIDFRSSIPDNLNHWQVFKDDKHIINFINNLKEFSDFQVCFQKEESYTGEDDQPSNHVPKKVVEWEKAFDRQDRCKKKEIRKLKDYIEINIGTEEEPRKIKIGKGTSEKERNNLIELVKEFRDVFAFIYDELKAYRDDIF